MFPFQAPNEHFYLQRTHIYCYQNAYYCYSVRHARTYDVCMHNGRTATTRRPCAIHSYYYLYTTRTAAHVTVISLYSRQMMCARYKQDRINAAHLAGFASGQSPSRVDYTRRMPNDPAVSGQHDGGGGGGQNVIRASAGPHVG